LSRRPAHPRAEPEARDASVQGFPGAQGRCRHRDRRQRLVETTQDRINTFADATGDEQWIHVDETRAVRELPGKTTIARGLLTLSLIPMFMRAIIGLQDLKNTVNYAANRIRYLSPVPAGSRLRARVGVLQAEDVPTDALRVPTKSALKWRAVNAPPVSQR
jgi:acyl dehydratase